MKPKSQLGRWIFSIYFPNYEKLKSMAETISPYIQILIFKEQLCMSNMDFYILYWTAQLNSAIY